jgi:manganese transport protein
MSSTLRAAPDDQQVPTREQLGHDGKPASTRLITAVIAFAVLALEQQGYRRFELAIAALLGLVFLGLCYDLCSVGLSPAEAARGLVPSFDDNDSVVLAVGIVGATVMPHTIYLHSALTKNRLAVADDARRRELLRFQRIDVIAGLACAGLVNLIMILIAADLFHTNGHAALDSVESAHAGLINLVGGGAALAFAVALLASGLASSGVGTYAGQVVMQGFVRRSVPLWSRRALTMLPALAVLALGLPTTRVLVVSQVALSFGVAFALVPLALLSRRRDVMGVWSTGLSPRRPPPSSPRSSSR